MRDVSKEELEKMGFKAFRVMEDGFTVHPDDVKAFIEWDSSPPTKEEIEAAKRSIEVAKRIKVKTCKLDEVKMEELIRLTNSRVRELEARLAKVTDLLMDNYPCYDENKCKNCKGDFDEIDYRTCVGYNVLTALRIREAQSIFSVKDEVK